MMSSKKAVYPFDEMVTLVHPFSLVGLAVVPKYPCTENVSYALMADPDQQVNVRSVLSYLCVARRAEGQRTVHGDSSCQLQRVVRQWTAGSSVDATYSACFV